MYFHDVYSNDVFEDSTSIKLVNPNETCRPDFLVPMNSRLPSGCMVARSADSDRRSERYWFTRSPPPFDEATRADTPCN